MGPAELARILEGLEVEAGEEVIAGFGGFEDAAVVKVDDSLALIATVDFITPVVDDPFIFGQIAAANALSDVYAMGGQPWFALNVLCFPSCIPEGWVRDIVKGGLSKIREAGAFLLGGHTVDDTEPKYGLCVVGRVHPERVITNSSAVPRCKVFLTKPIGLGVVVTAIKAQMASSDVVKRTVDVMTTLNKDASMKMVEAGAVAATDITGFGLLGHALEMARSSGVDIVIEAKKVPVIEEAFEYASMGLIPAGAYSNRDFCSGDVVFERDVGDLEILMFDPQTSGGLLVAVPYEKAHLYPYWEIGYTVEGKGKVRVV